MSDSRERKTERRFLSYIDKTDTCWLWTGGLSKRGYGIFHADYKTIQAHRWSYEHFVGPIPRGLVLDHVKSRGCTSTSCVNPSHLEAVTQKENVRRGNAGINNTIKTHCPRDHKYFGDNLYIAPDGRRGCVRCRRAAVKMNYHKKHPSVNKV